jgi:hypothetical protein
LRQDPTGTIVTPSIPTPSIPRNHPDMTAPIIEPPPLTDIAPGETDSQPTSDEPGTLPAHDLRELGLATAARALGIRVADLGPLQVRRAQADLVHCPICPGHQVPASVLGLFPAA